MENLTNRQLLTEQSRAELVTPQVDLTVLELLARPVTDFIEIEDAAPGPRPLTSTPTTQRTFDQANNRPDSVPDINQE